MKKLLIILFCSLVSMGTFAQSSDKGYYIYKIVSYSEGIDNDDFTLNVDDCDKVEYARDKSGKKIHFKTAAAALTYFESLGWELCHVGTSIRGKDTFLTYWVFKVKCSKTVYEKVIQNAYR